ncbi:hypothetical protein DL93DRAFT_2163683 [Clavulina sp. PMI_390]|nr:hypothetical protein DL93DRAFT_2163683 [Clavulina sp. PMI_390]
MKIHKQGKKAAPLHPELAEVVNRIAEIPQDDLPKYLADISMWMWPRSDLHSWVKVLNRFDDILKAYIDEYELDKLQTNPFSPLTKATITEILKFSTLLLDNSTNRKLFASYDRINSLLFCEDTDVIISALQLLLRPSQQYSTQPSAAQLNSISAKRLTSLASRWPISRENNLDFIDLYDASKLDPEVPADAASVSYTFYRKADPSAASSIPTTAAPPSEPVTPVRPKATSSSAAPTTPTPAVAPGPVDTTNTSSSAGGMVTIHIDSLLDSDKRPVLILAEEIEKHNIPDDVKFELLLRIRCAAALGPGASKQHERENLAIIRLLAIAIFAHTLNENEAQKSFFLYEPEVIQHVAELLHPDRSIAVPIQTAAIAALDGLARYRNKSSEVLAAVNAGVTHGILMSLMRRTLAQLTDITVSVNPDLPDALFGFANFIASTPQGGPSLVGAGIVPLLIQLLQIQHPSRIQILVKVPNLIDVMLYGYGNGFQGFVANRGVEVLLSRIEHEVNFDIEESHLEDPLECSLYGYLPLQRYSILKHLLRTIHRMMQQSGTSEGLRGLIDGPLPKTVKAMILHRGLFGPAIFSIAINIMASFVHNEPTSLAILQESGIPDAFYDAIERGLETVNEVIAAVPTAIGALCLNQPGLDQLTKRSTIIPKLFSILTSERHIKTLHDKDNAVYLGAAMDELMRHHPSLKDTVFASIKGVFEQISELGKAYTIPAGEEGKYGLKSATEPVVAEKETPLIVGEDSSSTPAPQASTSSAPAESASAGNTSEDAISNPILAYIDIACRFLEGLFQHPGHCRDFVNKSGGVYLVLNLYELPCLPTDFHTSSAAQSIIAVLRAMSEAVPTPTLERLTAAVNATLQETRDVWKPSDGKVPAISHFQVTEQSELVSANEKYRRLLVLHLKLQLLSQVYSMATYTHGRTTSNTILQVVNSAAGLETLENVSEMYRFFLWEGIGMKGADPAKQLAIEGSHVSFRANSPTGGESSTSQAAPAETVAKPEAPVLGPKTKPTVEEDNTKAVRHLFQNVTAMVTPLYQSIVKLFLLSRRNPESSSKQQANTAASNMAKIMIGHLEWRGSEDKITSYTYSTLIVGLLAIILFDERTSQNTLHTLLLLKLWNAGGITRVMEICQQFADTIEKLGQAGSGKSDEEASEHNIAVSGLGVTLHLLNALASNKAILESGQTSLLVTRDKPKTDPNYFESHQFLVKLRATVFPLLHSFWSSTWLLQLPQDIAKLIIQGFLEIMGADREESIAPSASAPDPLSGIFGASRRGPPPPTGPDENRIQQLVDMGFPRASAEIALTRTHNNLSAATEYLLLHPFPLGANNGSTTNAPAEPAPPAEDADEAEDAEDAEEAEADDEPDVELEPVAEEAQTDAPAQPQLDADPSETTTEPAPASDVEMADNNPTPAVEASAAPADEAPTETPAPLAEPIAVEEKDWSGILKSEREAATSSISERALELLGTFPDLVFDIKKAFTGDKYQKKVVESLITSAKSFVVPSTELNPEALSARLRLLALVLSEHSPSAPFIQEHAPLLVTPLIEQLESLRPLNSDEKAASSIVTPLLLTLDCLLMIGEDFSPVSLPSGDDPIPTQLPKPREPFPEARRVIFDCCFEILQQSKPSKDALIAALRLLVFMTRNHRQASEFVARGGLPLLLDRIKGVGTEGRGCQVHMILILRHVIEDRKVVEALMKRDLTHWFNTQTRNRPADVNHMVRHNSHVALRDHGAFIEACKAIATLTTSKPPADNYMVTLKVEAKTPSPIDGPSFEPPVVPLGQQADPDAMAEDGVPPSDANDSVDAMFRHLLSELTRVGKPLAQASSPVNDNVPSNGPTTDAPVDSGAGAPSSADPLSGDSMGVDFVYTCFLLQILTELLSGYISCKVAFLNYGRKKTTTPAKDSKLRSPILHFFFSDMLVQPDMNLTSAIAKKRATLTAWNMSTISALCSDPSNSTSIKNIPSEVVQTRKLVLDAIAKSFREVQPGESLESRYMRIGALGELTYRLVSRGVHPGAPRPTGDAHLHLPKTMLEKNFVAILTTTLGEVDLNFPTARHLVGSLVKALEILTKYAIRMGRATERKPSIAASVSEDEESDESMDEDGDDDEDGDEHSIDEETPDLYRNSALGMYGGDMEDVTYPADDGLEDVEEEEDDEEMEYGDEEMGSDHTSETSQDEDEEDEEDEDEEGDDEDLDVISENSHQPPWNEEPQSEGEEDEEVEEQEVVDGEVADPDEEALWEDDPEEIEDGLEAVMERLEEDGILPDPDDDGDEDEGIIPFGAVGDMGAIDIQLDTPDDFASWELAGAEGSAENGRSTFPLVPGSRSRRTLDITPGWSLARSDPTLADPSIHPLMATNSAARNIPPSAPHHHSRTTTRRSAGRGPAVIAADGTPLPPSLANMLQDLMGRDGFQMIEDMIARGGGGGDAILEFRAPGGQPISVAQLVGTRHSHHRPPPPPTSDISADPTLQVAEFNPTSTLQRWVDDAKMTQGRYSGERLNALVNYVVCALLPEARTREAAREAREAEEQAKALAAEKEMHVDEPEAVVAEADSTEMQTSDGAEPSASTPPPVELINEAGDISPMVEPQSQSTPIEPEVDTTSDDDDDVEMEDAEPASEPQAEAPIASSSPVQEGPSDQEHVIPETEPTTSSEAGPSSSSAPRITVMVHGNSVDITDTGIDPTFLEALPDDMRQEVINQHLQERRAAEPVARPEESQISADFLDALPPEIREELLQQERETQDRARRERERAANPPARSGGPSDMDSASFLATLDPALRQAVLMEQDEGFLQTLPSALLAEASALLTEGIRRSEGTIPPPIPSTSAPRKPPVAHEAIQLLDKSGVATLIRMLFFPQVLKKSSMHKVLANLCENSKTRADLFTLLLGVLQDGSVDVGSVDRSFSQLSVRHPKTPSKTPAKPRVDPSASLIDTPSSNPSLIIQRCLDALSYIVIANEAGSMYFLSEQEALPGSKRLTTRKGKGKEKHLPSTHYPVVLLLGLLDRESLVKSPQMLGMIAQLLAHVTKPLVALKEPVVSPEAVAAPSDSTAPPVPTDQPVTGTPPPPSESPDDEPKPTDSQPPKPLDNASKLRASPPQIPPQFLRLIANILTTGDCPAKTFQSTISLIQHLCYLPDAKATIAAELQSRAEALGEALLRDLQVLANVLAKTPEGSEISASSLSKFSSGAADQAKLLRLLKTLDFMYLSRTTTGDQPEGSTQPKPSAQEEEEIQKIYQSFRFEALWRQLSSALAIIEDRSSLDHVAIVLLPLIETLMVVSKHVGAKTQPPQATSPGAVAILSPTLSSRSPILNTSSLPLSLGSSDDLFVAFTDSHRKLLNLMVRNNPSLMSGSFSLLVNNPKVLDFDNKRNYFAQQLRRRSSREHHGTLQVNIRRSRVFEDSYHILHGKTGEQIRNGKLTVRFYEEEGVDAGGVTREWFQILARQMFNPGYALFQPCAGDKLTYQPNRASAINPAHLDYFQFVGRVIGKAIYDGRLLDAYFARSLYRQILGKPVDYRDVEWVDPEYYNSLCWILENDPSVLDMNFTIDTDEFGLRKVIELKENGSNISVTQENKREFVQLSAQYRLVTSIKEQIDALLGGLYEIIPKDLIAIFNEQEVELLISGTPDIDIDEWRAATEYHGYSQTDPTIAWWWRALKSFNRDERAKVLSFATGTSRVPLGGFGDLQGVQGVQKFSIHRAYGEQDRLPQAHTCFNQIDLPQFSSYEMLRQQLLLAINEGGEGFGFA